MLLDFIVGYASFALGNGIMCSISLWPSMKREIKEVYPFLRPRITGVHLHICWLVVGAALAPLLFFETIFGPSPRLTAAIAEQFID